MEIKRSFKMLMESQSSYSLDIENVHVKFCKFLMKVSYKRAIN